MRCHASNASNATTNHLRNLNYNGTSSVYRVTHLVANLVWVDFDLDVPPVCLAQSYVDLDLGSSPGWWADITGDTSGGEPGLG